MSLTRVLPPSGVNFLQSQNATQAASASRTIGLQHHGSVIFSTHSHPPLPCHRTRWQEAAGVGEGRGRSSLTPCGGLTRSISASVLLYLTVATVSRKEERGGKVNFPPPTQIFLASFVLRLPSQEGGVGRNPPIQSSLPRRKGFQPRQGQSKGPSRPMALGYPRATGT